MDYRQKMVVRSSQVYTHEDDDDEDLETLRLAALKSLKAKSQVAKAPQAAVGHGQAGFPVYKNHRGSKREFYYPNRQLRQNGQNVYYPSRNNQNLIEIVPVEANSTENADGTKKPDLTTENTAAEESKFHRYSDNASGSDEDSVDIKSKKIDHEHGTDDENQSNIDQNSPKVTQDPKRSNSEELDRDAGQNESTPATTAAAAAGTPRAVAEEEEEDDEEEEEEEEDEDDDDDPEQEKNDDDDDVLLMADLEEEDSLERLMDEMEREMTVDVKPPEKPQKKTSKKDHKDQKRSHESSSSSSKRSNNKLLNNTTDKKENSPTFHKTERHVHSPYRSQNHQRSISPRQKLRKKSPRRSPIRRSPSRQLKKCSRDIRRSPIRKLSPRGRSPRSSRSPSRRRSRSRSPRNSRIRSPKLLRSNTPIKLSPKLRSRSPRSPRSSYVKSPHRSPPRRSPRRSSRSPRSYVRSPKKISPNCLSPRKSSPKLRVSRSPIRSSPKRPLSPGLRTRSPKLSPHRSPWSSPRHSPRLSPRRKRSPIKDLTRKNRVRSTTPENNQTISNYKKEHSPEISKNKIKNSTVKELIENNPILEARKRKFESTKMIDPVNDNKKIKLVKKNVEKVDIDLIKKKSESDIDDEYEINDVELNLHDDNYDFDDLDDVVSNCEESNVTVCVDMTPIKIEKEKSKKKKKKDKEIYQVGKLKGELPLSERIGKEKKCKKRHRDLTPSSGKEDVETVEEIVDEEADLRTELSRRRAERLNRTAPVQSARLLQSAFKGVVNEVVKNNAKVQRHLIKTEDKYETLDSKVPVRFRLGLNKSSQDTRDSKNQRKSSKRQSRKVKHKNHMLANEIERTK